jgi:hypothetical protein
VGYRLKSGVRLWRIGIGEHGSAVLATIVRHTVAFSSDYDPDAQLVSGYSLTTGKRLWRSGFARQDTVSAVGNRLLIDETTSSFHDQINLLSPRTGHVRWSATSRDQSGGSSSVMAGSQLVTLYSQSQNQPFHIQYRKLATGTSDDLITLPKHQYVTSDLVTAGPGRVVFTDSTKRDHVEVASHGKILWRRTLPHFAVTAPVALPRHRVFAQTQALPCATAV